MTESANFEQSASLDLIRLFSSFVRARGAIPCLIISSVLSAAISSTVAVVPEILSDRYARLYHDYDGAPCSSFDRENMPSACHLGEDYAQAGTAWATFLSNILALFCNPMIGSLSDVLGRRKILCLSTFLMPLPAMVLVLMQVIPSVHPIWYYISNGVINAVSYLSLIFAALSDSMTEEFRAPTFAIILAGFYGGFALAPCLALVMSHFQVTMLSAALAVTAFLFTLMTLPETLPESVATNNLQARSEGTNVDGEKNCATTVLRAVTGPFRELSILNRNMMIRLVALGSFFSSMAFSSDASLLVVYIENQLNVREKDIAGMFFVMGILGITFQALLLQPLIKLLGHKGLLVTAFSSGIVHNFLYSIAKDKKTIYFALCFSQLTKTNYPILSSMASNGASTNEQGQVQGAMFAINSLSAAIGPVSMQLIYDHTKNSIRPGTMFWFGSLLYFAACVVASFIPWETNLNRTTEEVQNEEIQDELEEPLLPSSFHSR